MECKRLRHALNKYLVKKNRDNQLNRQVIAKRTSEYSKMVDTIENEICYALICKLGKEDISDDLITVEALEKLNESLALFLSDDSERQLLEKLVNAICGKIKKHLSIVPHVSKTMVGVESAKKILSWIEQNEINTIAYNTNDLLTYVVELFNRINIDDNIDIEKKCGQSISYQLSFLIGNIIDYLEVESTNMEVLKKLQKMVKYGVDTDTAIAVCATYFNDRIIANLVANKIGDSRLSEEEIANVIKYKKEEIEIVLQPFPTYFSERLLLLTR